LLLRWSLVATIGLLGAALLVTAWTSYAGVRDASALLIRGEANALARAVRSSLFQNEQLPSSAQLDAFLEEEADSGLRYIALLDHGGSVLAEAGTTLFPPSAASLRLEEPVLLHNRVRFTLGAGPRRPRADWPRRRGPLVVLEFEPVQAEALRTAATRTVGLGALAALVLAGVALALVRSALRREALERRLEHERHLASLGEMSAVLAHEIRNPLASLKGNAQLLAQSLPVGERDRQRADRVVQETVRLENLTHDLLDYVRSGQLRRESVDPTALLRASVEAVDPTIQLSVEGAPSTWSLDPSRMRQVLVNLLENAVQAGAPVRASLGLSPAGLTFEVRDAGPGVPPEDRERIFEPFFTRRTQGTGLGLSVARRVVELHGGSVSVEAPPGGGALFRVVLPPA
jgi:two-component system sensor histidine kinase HydH